MRTSSWVTSFGAGLLGATIGSFLSLVRDRDAAVRGPMLEAAERFGRGYDQLMRSIFAAMRDPRERSAVRQAEEEFWQLDAEATSINLLFGRYSRPGEYAWRVVQRAEVVLHAVGDTTAPIDIEWLVHVHARADAELREFEHAAKVMIRRPRAGRLREWKSRRKTRERSKKDMEQLLEQRGFGAR